MLKFNITIPKEIIDEIENSKEDTGIKKIKSAVLKRLDEEHFDMKINATIKDVELYEEKNTAIVYAPDGTVIEVKIVGL